MGQQWSASVGGTERSSAFMGLLEGGHHDLHYPYHSLVSGQITGRDTQSRPSKENWIKDLLFMTLPIRTGLSFPQSVWPYPNVFVLADPTAVKVRLIPASRASVILSDV